MSNFGLATALSLRSSGSSDGMLILKVLKIAMIQIGIAFTFLAVLGAMDVGNFYVCFSSEQTKCVSFVADEKGE